MRSLLGLLLALSLLSVIEAAGGIDVMRRGQCPQPPLKQNFDVERYMGKWWIYKRFPSRFDEELVCSYANYTLLTPTKVKVYNSGIKVVPFFRWILAREAVVFEGEAVSYNPAQRAELHVSITRPISRDAPPNYVVVDTDYDTYTVVFSCVQRGDVNIQILWILTRQQNFIPANIKEIYRTLKEAGINTTPLLLVEQSDC